MRKSLSLKRESLAELSSTDLVSVVGGQQQLLTHLSCNLTDGCGHGISFDYCPTIPLNNCIRYDLPASLLECIA